VAAATFLALGFVPGLPWFGLYRVDMLGVVLAVAAIAVLAGGTSLRRLVAAGLLAGLAILTKQTFVAALLAGSLWLLTRDRRTAVLFTGSALALVGVTATVLELTTRAFLWNTVAANLNPFDSRILESHMETLLSTQFMPLLLAMFYLWRVRPWRFAREQLLLAYWLASAIPLLGMGKVGSMPNYWIEFAGATSILAALGLWTACLTSRHDPSLHTFTAWRLARPTGTLSPRRPAATTRICQLVVGDLGKHSGRLSLRWR
jgi:hypothetical protein